ncbi:MAG: helix-turn-helix transcriptional regulator, partial [Chloroflexi bacterium]|nr:helix-turn-helix transcriptional regulator [Chloroflexota bacterium]
MSDGYRWKALGARIREARVRAGLTQKRLAELVGVRAHTAWCWEAGRMRPQRENLVAIAHHTGTTPEQLEG